MEFQHSAREDEKQTHLIEIPNKSWKVDELYSIITGNVTEADKVVERKTGG